MITLQRRHVIIFLQMVFLVLLVFARSDQESQLHQSVADSSRMHLIQDCDDISIECADMEEDTSRGDHAGNPEYFLRCNRLLSRLTPASADSYPAAHTQSLPLVYLPVFSPPKIRA